MADIAPQTGIVVELDEDAPLGAPPAALSPELAALPELDAPETEAEQLPPQAKRQDDGSVAFTLLHPVTLRYRKGDAVREERIEALTLRRLSGRDLRQVSGAGKEAGIMAVALSAGMTKLKFDAVFDAMDAEDAAAAIEVVERFLTSGRRTGR